MDLYIPRCFRCRNPRQISSALVEYRGFLYLCANEHVSCLDCANIGNPRGPIIQIPCSNPTCFQQAFRAFMLERVLRTVGHMDLRFSQLQNGPVLLHQERNMLIGQKNMLIGEARQLSRENDDLRQRNERLEEEIEFLSGRLDVISEELVGLEEGVYEVLKE